MIVAEGPTWPKVIERLRACRACIAQIDGTDLVSWDVIHWFEDYKAKVIELQDKVDAIGILGTFPYTEEQGNNLPYDDVPRWTADNRPPSRLQLLVGSGRLRHTLRRRRLGLPTGACCRWSRTPNSRRQRKAVCDSYAPYHKRRTLGQPRPHASVLHDRGIKLAIDDFGKGFSSLSRLQVYPIDSLKMNRSFVANLGSDAKARAVVASIVALGHNLGMDVVGEGVETQEQFEILFELQTDQMQGFLFHPALPAADAERLVQRQAFSEAPLTSRLRLEVVSSASEPRTTRADRNRVRSA